MSLKDTIEELYNLIERFEDEVEAFAAGPLTRLIKDEDGNAMADAEDVDKPLDRGTTVGDLSTFTLAAASVAVSIEHTSNLKCILSDFKGQLEENFKE